METIFENTEDHKALNTNLASKTECKIFEDPKYQQGYTDGHDEGFDEGFDEGSLVMISNYYTSCKEKPTATMLAALFDVEESFVEPFLLAVNYKLDGLD